MTPDEPSRPQDANEEISALIEVLHSTGRRLEELTAGEVDGVADREGRTFVLQHVQEQLRQNEATRQANILNALPAQIALLDSRGRIVTVNRAWQQFVEANTPRDMDYGIGSSYLDICDNMQGEYAATAKHAAAGVRAVQHGATIHFSMEYPFHSSTGQFWFLMTASPLAAELQNGVVIMRLDITERKQAEEESRASELDASSSRADARASKADATAERDIAARLQAILDTVVDGVITIDGFGTVGSFNPAAERIFGYAADEVIGRNIKMLMPEPYQGEHDACLARYRATGRASIIGSGREVMGLRKDGGTFPLDLSISEMTLGSQCHYTGVVRDITERKVAEQTVVAARIEAERANTAKNTFLANMSHEIRTPMNGVIGMIEVLQQSALSGTQTEMTNIIRDSSLALLDVINDILDFSKIEAGKLEIDHSPMCVADVVEKVCRILDRMALMKKVELTLFADPAIPDLLIGDPGRLRQILINLANNAIKFSSTTPRAGRVSVRVLLAESDSQGVWLEFQVADNGIGLDEASLARIFSPFVQADISTTRKYGGTGLGLVISRQLAEMMGGHIDVSSEPGVGSLFSLSLPLKLPPGNALAERRPGLLAGLSCLVFGNADGLAGDLVAYLTHDGAVVERTAELATARQWIANRTSGLGAVIIDSQHASQPLEDLRAAAQAHLQTHPARDTRFVVIRRGLRRELRAEDSNLVSVDGNVLTHRTLLNAVAMAAGLALPPVRASGQKSPEGGDALLAPLSADTLTPHRRGGLILVAEDNEINQQVILHQLTLLGYVAEFASDGRDALARWQEGHYDLLLTDLQMPEMDGYDLTAAIRSAEVKGERLPIVALTANALKSEELHCKAVGMDDYLTKPVLLDQLKAVLDKWRPVAGQDAVAVEGAAEPAADHVATLTASSQLAVLDRSVLPKLIGDNPELMEQFFSEYRRSAQKISDEIREASALGDWKTVSDGAHTLKSSSRAVGALALGEVCHQLEHACRDGHADAARALAAEFENAMAAALDAMNHNRPASADPPRQFAGIESKKIQRPNREMNHGQNQGTS